MRRRGREGQLFDEYLNYSASGAEIYIRHDHHAQLLKFVILGNSIRGEEEEKREEKEVRKDSEIEGNLAVLKAC